MTEKTEPASALQPVDSASASPPDEPPFTDYATDAETDAFWDGVTQGIRSAGGVSPDDEAKLRWRTDGGRRSGSGRSSSCSR
jgi:hypothetical protein